MRRSLTSDLAVLDPVNVAPDQREVRGKMYAVREAIVEDQETGESPDVVLSTSRKIDEFDAFSRGEKKALYDIVKRTFDISGALLLGGILSPVIAATALIVKLGSPGPVIFRQKRLTKDGKVFTLLKFRTMVEDAERDVGAVWAANDDPRVTALGRFLRRTRLDELPQLFNVLQGDMSLIGPRPERPELADQLSKEFPSFHRRLEVKAGITGLAQVGSGYASCLRSYRKKLALDLLYIQNRCMLLDLRIALKTILVIITGSGAR